MLDEHESNSQQLEIQSMLPTCFLLLRPNSWYWTSAV